MTDILHYSGTNTEEKKKIENEQEAWRTINAMFEDKEKKYLRALSEKDKALSEKDKALNEKDKALEEMQKELEALRKKLNE